MRIIYLNKELEEQCTNLKLATKLFNGRKDLAIKLLARINTIEQSETIRNIIVQPQLHFHNLENKYGKDFKGYFAIDVKGRKEPWRIILEPLDENEQPYNPCNIDEISGIVRIVSIKEVSKHYE